MTLKSGAVLADNPWHKWRCSRHLPGLHDAAFVTFVETADRLPVTQAGDMCREMDRSVVY
jgi:hypothetical protein